MWFKEATVLSLAALSLALPQLEKRDELAQDPLVIHQFPDGYEPENLLQRSTNNQLVVTMNTPPAVYQVDPITGLTRSIHNFTKSTSGGGIIEMKEDVFLVAMGDANSTSSTGTLKTWALHKIDLRKFLAPKFNPNTIVISEAVSVPGARVIDGMDWINKGKGLVAAADYVAGVIRLIDIPNQKSSVLSSSPLFKGEPNKLFPGDAIGVNGIKVRNSSVYFTTTTQGIFGRVPVNINTGKATGPAETVFNFTKSTTLDDFNFSDSGNVYLSTLNTPGGGFLKRPAGTPDGTNGTRLVVSAYGTNAVILDTTSQNCILYFTNALQGRIENALFENGPC